MNATIGIQISKEDYQESFDQQIKDYRRKAKIPGFRQGHVPVGVVKQMIGKSVLFDEVNKLTNKGLYDYLKDNNIDILGQPISSDEKESELNFDQYGDFQFYFD